MVHIRSHVDTAHFAQNDSCNSVLRANTLYVKTSYIVSIINVVNTVQYSRHALPRCVMPTPCGSCNL